MPDIDIPEITVHVVRDNASAEDLERRAVGTLIGHLQHLSNVSDIVSETRNSYSIIRITFQHGTDINMSFVEANEQIDLAMTSLPREFERPKVVKVNTNDIPVFSFNINYRGQKQIEKSRDFRELSDFAKNVVKRRLEQLPEVAFVDISGTEESEIIIKAKKEYLRALDLNVRQMQELLTDQNPGFQSIIVTEGDYQYQLGIRGTNLNDVEDIKSIVIPRQEKKMRLGDVADVSIVKRKSRGEFYFNRSRAVNMAIIKTSNENLDQLEENVQKVIKDIEREYPQIAFTKTRDQTLLLNVSISNLKQDLIIGLVLAFLILLLFLRESRAPMLIGITVPTSLVLTVCLFYLLGLSINIISLSGLVLGVGLMIDNSIIVIDNITQHRRMGKSLHDACVNGVNEVINPLLFSTITTTSVFVPLSFLSGIAGALFHDQAMAIFIGLASSLIVSVTLLPILYKVMYDSLGDSTRMKPDVHKQGLFEKIYELGFKWTFENRGIIIVAAIALLAADVWLFNKLPKEKMPSLKYDDTEVYIDWNEDINLSENANRVLGLLGKIETLVEVSEASVGEESFLLSKERALSVSEAKLYLKCRGHVQVSKAADQLSKLFSNRFPSARIRFSPPKNIFEKIFGGEESTIQVQLFDITKDKSPSHEAAARFTEAITSNFKNAIIEPLQYQSEAIIVPDIEKLNRYNVSLKVFTESLNKRVAIQNLGRADQGSKSISIGFDSGVVSDLSQLLRNLFVENSEGVSIPASTLGTIQMSRQLKNLNSGKLGRYIPINIVCENPDEIIAFIKRLDRKDENIEAKIAGQFLANKAQVREMSTVLLAAILTLFFVLGIQFGSLVQSAIVLCEIPLGIGGALIFLGINGASINLVSLIGLVVICGIIINDSIIKIDTINRYRQSGNYTLANAIHLAGKNRLKAITMTALTTTLTVVPFLFAKDIGSLLQQPLSLAIIGGMFVGTPVSLYFIPLVYYQYYNLTDRFGFSKKKWS
nr:efflux RND transporter permease subunit [uncultured Dyadobacter sp.]